MLTAVGLEVILKSLGAAVTVTLAVPLTLLLAAATVKGPPAVEPAVNSPELLMVPPPLTDQVNAGCGVIGLPNGSRPVAVNCCGLPTCTEALAGESAIVVRTGGALVQEGNLKEPIRVFQLKVPLDGMYSFV